MSAAAAALAAPGPLDLELREAVSAVIAAFDAGVFHVNDRAGTSMIYYLEKASPAERALLVLRRWALTP